MNTSKLYDYFKRIKYNGSTNPSIETLNALHESHVFSIPFEAIDTWLNQPVSLNFESIFKKLVLEKRGGYCYEMNSLFYSVLKFLGFDVKLQVAEVVYDGKAFRSRPPRHAILIVTIDEIDYLVDVGYGRNGLIHPLELCLHKSTQVFASHFQLAFKEKDGFVFKFDINGTFKPEYRFDYPLKGLTIEELEPHNDWTASSEESSFRQHLIITKPTISGRISLIDKELRIISKGRVEKIEIESFDRYLEVLKENFGIKLNKPLEGLLEDKLAFYHPICTP